MALMNCHECGARHSRDAASCPSCGVPKNKRPVKGAGKLIAFAVLTMFFGFPVLIGILGADGSGANRPQLNTIEAKIEANVRTGPGTSFDVHRKTMPGERLQYQAVSGDWYQLAGTPTLFIHKSVVTPYQPPRKASQAAGRDRQNQAIWIAKAKDSVRYNLKDGSSAKFRNVEFVRGPGNAPMVRGQVNAKNGFGAYAGFERFVSAGSPELTFLESNVTDFHKVWNETRKP